MSATAEGLQIPISMSLDEARQALQQLEQLARASGRRIKDGVEVGERGVTSLGDSIRTFARGPAAGGGRGEVLRQRARLDRPGLRQRPHRAHGPHERPRRRPRGGHRARARHHGGAALHPVARAPGGGREEGAPLEHALSSWEQAAQWIRLFVASAPAADHPGLQSPRFAALRDGLSLFRKTVDEVAPPPRGKDRN